MIHPASAPPAPPLWTVATYNVHAWVGMDRRFAPNRVIDVINAITPDVLALQEVVSPYGDRRRGLHSLAELTGMEVTAGPTMLRGDAHYGNLLLSRNAPTATRLHDVSLENREPRGVIEAHFSTNGLELCVLATHLGLNRKERRHQTDALLQIVAGSGADVTLLLADANEWLPFSRSIRRLDQVLGSSPTRRSFPSLMPVFHLDRIWISPPHRLASLTAMRVAGSRLASDHLPVVATMSMAP